ncbi:Yip1 family protein [Tahibacter soli]|uniref:Yip1 family protein n=1 Tax=Tahibacter soli TaxID=2983605 RepID=A0A9X4BGV6_9GAMM|nr:Yip1 family protein [Tahibacter soli]MDC8013335.1 Yip1 family protein [Tahibacter soli]
MDVNALIARVKNILLTPKTEWPVIAAERTTVADLYKNYILILAAIPAVFGFIKSSLIGLSLFGVTVRVGFFDGIGQMILAYGLSLGIVYLVGLLIDALAPTFGGEKNPEQALKSAAYAYTAGWVASVTILLGIPLYFIVALAAAAYGIYLLYLGLPYTMKAPPERAAGYAAVVIVIGFVASLVGGGIINAMFGSTTGLQGGMRYGNGTTSVEVDPNSTLGRLAAMGERADAASKQLEQAQRSGDAQAQAAAAGAVLGAVLSGGDASVEALAPDRLKGFIPDTFGNLPRTDYRAEKNGIAGMQVSEASGWYGDGSGRSLTLTITDSGSVKGVMAFAGWANVESESQHENGYEKTYRSGGRLTHEQWDGASKSGEYSVIVGDRFAVKVEGGGDSIDTLKRALDTVDLRALEALKNEGVKKG